MCVLIELPAVILFTRALAYAVWLFPESVC